MLLFCYCKKQDILRFELQDVDSQVPHKEYIILPRPCEWGGGARYSTGYSAENHNFQYGMTLQKRDLPESCSSNSDLALNHGNHRWFISVQS